jgi:hypothetical protein
MVLILEVVEHLAQAAHLEQVAQAVHLAQVEHLD